MNLILILGCLVQAFLNFQNLILYFKYLKVNQLYRSTINIAKEAIINSFDLFNQFKPLKSVCKVSRLICKQFLLMITIITFLFYSFQFSQENNIMIGWIHIGMFCTILASNLLIDLLGQKSKKKKIEEEKKASIQPFLRILSKLKGQLSILQMRIPFFQSYYIHNTQQDSSLNGPSASLRTLYSNLFMFSQY
ncbi:unnamed protein product [Paramecium sonneborni]|uniref:Transmembrane protein n=1 Tax=Paramecium sonneborni TaxID=65129 RepID=A0A8S1RBT3_9CILI|nr:unnamed protein product [Paramecium sonneborni]